MQKSMIKHRPTESLSGVLLFVPKKGVHYAESVDGTEL